MLTREEIRNKLDRIPPGTKVSVSELKDYIEAQCALSQEDWKSHTESRKTTYPVWKQNVQVVLSEYKKKGRITHDTINHIVIFK